MTVSSLELRSGELRLALRPDLGGCLAGLWRGDLPVMLSAEPDTMSSVRPSASYPLVPYSNRVGYCRFRWHGTDYTTRRNFDTSPHSVHGVGWQRPWAVGAHSDTAATLTLEHPGDADWPFAFRAEQRFELTPESLTLHLSLLQTDARPAPVGLGWHPYFPKRSRSRLHVELSDRWESDPSTQLPTRRVGQPGIDGDVAHLDFDHCFEGWTGAARLRDEKLSLKLSSSLPYLVVYTPPHKPYYCVEPVSHVSNAIHMANPQAHGLRELRQGERMDAWMRLEIARV
ncbi:MAG: aldose 1-epimerase [Rubrivivax sp.]|nr:aldose 1-epimerase [Rubrivivax sp.]